MEEMYSKYIGIVTNRRSVDGKLSAKGESIVPRTHARAHRHTHVRDILRYRIFQIKTRLTKEVVKAGKIPTTETVYSFLIERARSNMHLILCMSPIGDAFRNRLRQYPALINCTTIDWFLEWPREALLEVGNKFLMNLNLALTITGETKEVGTPCPFPRDRFHSIRFLRSTRVSYHQSSIAIAAAAAAVPHPSAFGRPDCGESDYFPIYGLPYSV